MRSTPRWRCHNSAWGRAAYAALHHILQQVGRGTSAGVAVEEVRHALPSRQWMGFHLLLTANRLVLGRALGGESSGREQVAVVGALGLDGGAGLEPTGQVTTVADEHRGVAARDTEDVG